MMKCKIADLQCKPIQSSWKVYNFDFEDLSKIPNLPQPRTSLPRRQNFARSLKLHHTSPEETISLTTTEAIHSTTSKEEDNSDGPIFYRGVLRIEGDLADPVPDAAGQHHLADTYLATHGLGKGVAWVNGFNLGWYWPTMGPQMTLYVPGPVLQPGDNDVLILEVEKVERKEAPNSVQVSFVDEPDFYGPEGVKINGGGGGRSGFGRGPGRGRHWGSGGNASEKSSFSVV